MKVTSLYYNLPLLASDPIPNATSAARTITFPGLPAVTYDVIQSHLSAVRIDGRLILIVVTAPDGAVQSMEAPGRWSWRFATGGGNIHHRFAVTGGHGQYDGDVPMDTQQLGSELPVFLDTVRDELGLPEVWQGMTVVRSVGADGYDVIDSGTRSTIVRLRQSADDVRVGLSSSGAPLFYDLRLPVSVPDAQAGAVPTRLIVSHTGRMQLALAAPRHNAITSVMWSADPRVRGVTYNHFVLEMPAGTGRVHSLMMWQCGAYYSCYDDPNTGYTCWWQDQYCDSTQPRHSQPPYDGGGGPGGGGTPPPQTPQDAQRDLYVSQPCSPVPFASDFLDSSGYGGSGLQNYFSFADFKSPSKDYVLVDSALVTGLAAMSQTVTIPGLSDPGNGAGYRIPGANSATPCGDHIYGTAVDLNVHNSNGAHDCHIWNALAAAGNAAGGWVEPASMIAPNGGVPNHFHIAFDGRTNTNYGDACTN